MYVLASFFLSMPLSLSCSRLGFFRFWDATSFRSTLAFCEMRYFSKFPRTASLPDILTLLGQSYNQSETFEDRGGRVYGRSRIWWFDDSVLMLNLTIMNKRIFADVISFRFMPVRISNRSAYTSKVSTLYEFPFR